MKRKQPLPNPARIESRILALRGVRVLLDGDLAELYGVTTKALNQAVGRNRLRFPPDFAFRLSSEEAMALRSQSVTSNGRGGRRYLPRVFAEQGVAMLSSVLRSPRAVAVNVAIMRAFVRLREMALTHAELTRRLAEIERRYDGKFAEVFRAIRVLAQPTPPEAPRPRIGFTLPPASSNSRAKSRR